MNVSPNSPWGRGEASPFAIRLHARAGLIAIGLVLVGMLAAAAILSPAESGYGTHRQLGLPPCSFMTVTGWRCPSCGMTTAWAHLMRGNVVRAAASNVGGLALGIVAAGVGPWALVSGIRGKWALARPRESLAVLLTAGVVTITLVDWAIRLYISR